MSHGVAVALSRLSKDRERLDKVGSIVSSCFCTPWLQSRSLCGCPGSGSSGMDGPGSGSSGMDGPGSGSSGMDGPGSGSSGMDGPGSGSSGMDGPGSGSSGMDGPSSGSSGMDGPGSGSSGMDGPGSGSSGGVNPVYASLQTVENFSISESCDRFLNLWIDLPKSVTSW